MSRWDADVAVIGLGAWGAAALWQLASRGVDVIGFESRKPGHALSSSYGGSRMFRTTCLEHPGLVPLARRSLELWQRLQDEAGQRLFFPGGGLLIGPEAGVIVGGTLRAARTHGIEVRSMGVAELRERFPQHTGVPGHHLAVWEPSAGILRAEDSVRAATGLAGIVGARVYTDTRVRAVKAVDGGVVLRTAEGESRVRRVVITAGSWLSALVGALPLETLRMPLTWFRPVVTDGSFELDRFPVFMRETEEGPVLWGNGTEGGHEVKLGLEGYGPGARALDPEDDGERALRPEDWTDLARMLPGRLPGLEELPAKAAVSLFTRTPDGQFVLGALDGDPRVVVAGGCNAHGFKHATGIGEALADLATGRIPEVPLDFLSPGRFGGRVAANASSMESAL
ncbi:N-methyl-L-tryptophan oxidase [Streptomyces sp. ISL-94]|uniref:N-methyl-L-tryptophan oxidase n=1 Tax=Streptomyces sp. ISL-94 TaxID=2819190 RepID=UPI001BE7A4E6|nr:N-methyl-L-tryptophan oxidase [Streptomyces sp. ISL-94]MBT2481605.1 N-methyl-L-tryptophan oxidase [Streptomyces sp. ISL-94]